MAARSPLRKIVSTDTSDQDEVTVSWPELVLALGSITLFFQLFPSALWALVSILDVRGWSWRSYAVASVLWIVVLVGIKAWRDSRAD